MEFKKVYLDPDCKEKLLKDFPSIAPKLIEDYERFYNEKIPKEREKRTWNDKLKRTLIFINPNVPIETTQKGEDSSINSNKSYADVKDELKTLRSLTYKVEVVKRILHEKPDLRKVFAAILINEPARFAEIQEGTFAAKRTIYGYLWKLKEMGIIEMRPVMDVWNKENLLEEDAAIISKFTEWTKNMTPSQRQMYAGKTRYFIPTKLGQDSTVVNWILKLEKEDKK